MTNFSLDQKLPAATDKAANTSANLQKKSHKSILRGSIMEKLVDFAFSIDDFRRTGRGNHRHELGDIIILMILARMSRCICRADIIEFGKNNLHKFQSIGMLKNVVPSEPTLCRVENGIDETRFADSMADFYRTFNNELVRAFKALTADVSSLFCSFTVLEVYLSRK